MKEINVVNYENENFTIVINSVFQNKALSLKAKGLLGYMLSLPKDWDYSVKGLEKQLKDGERAIRNALKELEINGHLERKTTRIKGKYSASYTIYSRPKNRRLKQPSVDTSPLAVIHAAKQPTVHPYIQSTNNKVLKESNTLAETDITLQQITNLVLQHNLKVQPNKVFHYLKSRKWKSKSGIKITSASILDYLQEWESRNEDFGYVEKKSEDKPEAVKWAKEILDNIDE